MSQKEKNYNDETENKETEEYKSLLIYERKQIKVSWSYWEWTQEKESQSYTKGERISQKEEYHNAVKIYIYIYIRQ